MMFLFQKLARHPFKTRLKFLYNLRQTRTQWPFESKHSCTVNETPDLYFATKRGADSDMQVDVCKLGRLIPICKT